jgi:hypothetical protein
MEDSTVHDSTGSETEAKIKADASFLYVVYQQFHFHYFLVYPHYQNFWVYYRTHYPSCSVYYASITYPRFH